ncbi:MAG: protein kinase [Chloroflexi bacterium]|nr:protein kinase [Chloroflexota bacterium]
MAEQQRSAANMGPPPRLKDRYRLVEWLGQGGMGVIYRATDEVLDRDVAIKFLPPERLTGTEASARFLREARAVARLTHLNIMTLYDVDREGAWHYLVLEYIQGQNLHTIRLERGGKLPATETLPIIRSVLEALAYAHAQGIIHRDIKPQNIMLTPTGQVKVTDFGLALAHEDVRLTQEGVIIGSPLYLAPEMVMAEAVDSRGDLYSVGAILYELLTGQPPFSSQNPMALFSQILTAPVTPPAALEPNIPPGLERVILKLLAKNPVERYASAQEVMAALSGGPADLPHLPGQTEAETPDLTSLEGLLVHAVRSAEDTAMVVEAERRRLAHLLQSSVVEALNLLLAQANAYEQTLGANPTVRMAVSVLSTLARQALQQARDLESNLRPTILETLGLEPALEALAGQTMRAHGLQITLALARLPERLPPPIELALFRLTQEVIDRAIHQAHASQIAIHLEHRDEKLRLHLADNSLTASYPPGEALRLACQRLEQLGGHLESGPAPETGFTLTVIFTLTKPTPLTARELEVLRLLVEGLSNKQMARRLSLSPRTVNFHLDNIYSKLGVRSRTEAAIYAVRQGLLN